MLILKSRGGEKLNTAQSPVFRICYYIKLSNNYILIKLRNSLNEFRNLIGKIRNLMDYIFHVIVT